MEQSSVRAAAGLSIADMGASGKMQALSREARSNQRRLLTAFGLENDSDLLKFNQLKVSVRTKSSPNWSCYVRVTTECARPFNWPVL